MDWTALSGALALAIAGFGMQERDPGNAADPETAATGDPDTEEFTETLSLERDSNQRLTVPVTIMGQGPFDFMVDTGAQATVLSEDLATQLELFDREPALLIGMASSRMVETTIVPEFALGERIFTIRQAPIVDGANIGSADGILGLDSLQNQRVLLDFRNRRMTVSESFEAGGANGYDIVVRARERLGQLIIHRARIDGVSTAVLIDTGASGSIGNLALQRRLRNRPALEDATMTDVNGVAVTSETRIARSLRMGEMQITNFPVSFAASPTFTHLGLEDEPAMILGMNELRMFRRVAIDFRDRRVLFEFPDELTTDQAWNFNERATRLHD